MSGTISELSLTYDPVNNYNTITNGDVINGRVVLQVAKEVKIDSLFVKCKGEANVHWSEDHGERTRYYSSSARYFKLKQYFIQDPSKKGKEDPGAIISEGETYGNVVKPGRHVYPFSLQVPQGNFPASFKGHYGSAKYILEVILDRSWKIDRNIKQEISFVPRFHSAGADLMNPQSGTVDKKMKLFTSGNASVRASINKMGFVPGETIKISSDVDNSSSRDLKIKYSLDQVVSFCAQGHSKYSSKNIFKVVGDPVPSQAKQTINTDLVLPTNLELTIESIHIIKVEYTLKVYLDVPYARDLVVTFPVVILPPGLQFAPWPNQPGFEAPAGPGKSDFPSQPILGPSPPDTTFGPAPGLYPNLYPSPLPEAPPPSYAEICPNPNQTTPGFSPAPSGPAFNPPQYEVMGYPHQYPAPSAPAYVPDPSAPPYVPAGGALGCWPNSVTQPDPYPTKTPEKPE